MQYALQQESTTPTLANQGRTTDESDSRKHPREMKMVANRQQKRKKKHGSKRKKSNKMKI